MYCCFTLRRSHIYSFLYKLFFNIFLNNNFTNYNNIGGENIKKEFHKTMLHDGIIYLADEKLLVHLFIFNGARVLTSDGYVPIKCNFELILNDNNDYIKLIGKEFDIKFSNLTVSGCKISEHNSNQTIDNLGHIEGRIQQDCSKLFKY